MDITDTVETPSTNGVVSLAQDNEPRLGHGALRRLQRLQQRVEGATEVAQAAVNAHAAARDAYEATFTAACEDTGIAIPPGPHEVDIDWYSGTVRFRPRD